jgi:hypothetical protein
MGVKFFRQFEKSLKATNLSLPTEVHGRIFPLLSQVT